MKSDKSGYFNLSMVDIENKPKIVIVGGGLVGALNAVFFGKCEKFDVLLCEKRSDIRLEKQAVGRSINLSLSFRGRSALKAVDLEDEIMRSSIPMYARMIHEKNGNLKHIPYSKSNEYICALDRKVMNELLLTEAEKCENVKTRFNWKLVGVDMLKKIARFSNSGGINEIEYDLLVGNDGAFSSVRQYMSKYTNLDFSQEYISHGYKELYFPSKENNEFQMKRNCLHIWPRDDFMLIGLPNPGGSFTGTLFMPFDLFEGIKTTEDLLKFFKKNFPDALEYMGKTNLEKIFFQNKVSPIVTIRCKPYHYEDSCVIMGDAAHAMVPFYGQGMNCGFEDLIIFHEILKRNNYKFGSTCSEFTKKRNEDAKAICELSFFNYIEMRKHVTSKSFLIRKKIDNLMYSLFPSLWIPLYTMVTFTRIPYKKCIKEREKQDKILKILRRIGWMIVLSSMVIVSKRIFK